MAERSITQRKERSGVSETGSFRLRLHLSNGRIVTVGCFPSLLRCSTFALDLATGDGPRLLGLDIQHKNRGTYRPVWSWRAAKRVPGAAPVFPLRRTVLGR